MEGDSWDDAQGLAKQMLMMEEQVWKERREREDVWEDDALAWLGGPEAALGGVVDDDCASVTDLLLEREAREVAEDVGSPVESDGSPEPEMASPGVSDEAALVEEEVESWRKEVGVDGTSEDTGEKDVSAVDRAKRRAEEFAIAQVEQNKAKKPKMGSSGSLEESNGSEVHGSSERNQDPDARKYQRRLEKNRNSAFVSRIRRRAYTGFLEESLEKEENHRKNLERELEKMKRELQDLKRGRLSSEGGGAHHAGQPLGFQISDAIRSALSPISSGQISPVGVSTMFVFVLLMGLLIPGMTIRGTTESLAKLSLRTVENTDMKGMGAFVKTEPGKVWSEIPSILTGDSMRSAARGWTPWKPQDCDNVSCNNRKLAEPEIDINITASETVDNQPRESGLDGRSICSESINHVGGALVK